MTEAEIDNRVVILNRVSSLRQEDGFSLDAQNEINVDYCNRKGLYIVQTFTFSESAGAAKVRREFLTVLDFLKKQEIKHLVVEKTDRLLRNFYDYIKVEEMMQEHALHVHFPKEGSIIHKSSNSHEKQVFGFKVLIAKGFLDNLSEETKKGLRKKVESGGYPIRAPYGYQHDLGAKQLLPKQPEADIIRDLFIQYSTENISLDDMADQLNDNGITAPRGSLWHASALHKIFHNPVYYGDVRWKGALFKGSHEPLVSYQIWLNVQEKLKIKGGPKQKRRYLLAGLIKLPNGRMFTGELQKAYVYYGAWLDPQGKKGGKMYIREDRLFDLLEREILRFGWSDVFHDKALDLARALVKEEKELVSNNFSAFEHQLEQLEQKKQRLLNIYVDGQLDRVMYLNKMAELNKNEIFVNSKLNALKFDDQELVGRVQKIAQDFLEIKETYAISKPVRKIKILESLCDKIVIDTDFSVNLNFKELYRPFIQESLLGVCQSRDPVQIHTLLRPLGESNPCCGNENPES